MSNITGHNFNTTGWKGRYFCSNCGDEAGRASPYCHKWAVEQARERYALREATGGE